MRSCATRRCSCSTSRFANLDAELRTRLRSEIKKLHRKLRATVVYVTHDQVEAMTLADRIVILNKGRVEQVGSPMDVYAAPVNLFVAGFIGSPAMNMIPAEFAVDAKGRPSITAAGVSLPLDPSNETAFTPGMKATLGIRPEDIAVLPPGGEAPATVEAHVTIVEPLGAEFLLSFALSGHEIMAKVAGRALPESRGKAAFRLQHGPRPCLRRGHGTIAPALSGWRAWPGHVARYSNAQ